LPHADLDPARRGRPLHAAATGARALQRARRGGLRDGARRLPARGARLDGARAPARRLEPRARLARAPLRLSLTTARELETPHGPARVHLRPVDSPRAWVVLGHGAGGGVESPDLVGAAQAAGAASMSVALVEQPYRVAGRRSPAPAVQLDAVTVPTLIVQGENDPFGIAPPGPNRTVTRIPGTHSLRNSGAVAEAVSEWLARIGW